MYKYRILAVDGGGIRGIIPAFWLKHLESWLQEKHQKTLTDVFDLFVGTSTGAIIAAALANRIQVSEIFELYKSRGGDVFSRTWKDALLRQPSLRPKYSPDVLERELREKFEDTEFAHAEKHLLVTAFNPVIQRPVVFDSQNPQGCPKLTRDACRASSAAPTYFPAFVQEIDSVQKAFVDGGLTANNPAGVALVEAFRKGYSPKDILLVSLGTGEPGKGITAAQAQRWGWAHWAKPIVNMLFDGNSGTTESLVNAVMDTNNYFRLQCDLDKATNALDDSSKANIADLLTDADARWQQLIQDKTIDRLKNTLLAARPLPPHRLEGRWKSIYKYIDPATAEWTDEISTTTLTWDGEQYSGNSVDGKSRWQFSAKVDHNYLVGEWKNISSQLSGVFMLRISIEEENVSQLNGHWIGKADNGSYYGNWTLERLDET